MIHKTAIIDPSAELDSSVDVGPYAIIEGNVKIGAGCSVGSHALVASGARIGKNVKIHHGAVVGTIPQDLKFEGEESTANIGDDVVIREFATVNRGTKESGSTDVGNGTFLMAYAHVAHDCKIGESVIMANSVNLAGHVKIDDFAIIGGVVPVHQFVRIGKHAMIGGGFRVTQDVCPYVLAGGYPLKVVGLNTIGLRRRNFPKETIATLEKAFRILFSSKLNTTQALKKIREEIELIPEIQDVLELVENSSRGIVK
jgi:UDP-N-acetylglucosamine acyltransferase